MGVLSYLCKVLTFNVSNVYCLDFKNLFLSLKREKYDRSKGGWNIIFHFNTTDETNQRRLYGIYIVCFLIFTILCICKIVFFFITKLYLIT